MAFLPAKLLSPSMGDNPVSDGKKLYADLEDLRRSLAQEEDELGIDEDTREESRYVDFAPAEHE